MRGRMARDLRPHGPWDTKLRTGGLIDIEFIAQVLTLVHIDDPRFRRSQTTHIALQRLARAGVLDPAEVQLLVQAERLWRTIQGMLRMTVGRLEAVSLPSASEQLLLQAAAKTGVAAVDAADLLRRSETIAQQVRAMFERYVGKPDG
jgi:[glutamine synthetase] adenylyltransferase / [glutamine synthetase]-adenylyl-L-tyrosine phosphorylase